MEGITFYFGFEQDLIIWLQNLLGEAGTAIGTVLTGLGETVFLIVLLGGLYWCYDKETAKKIGVYIVFALMFNSMSKNLVLRRRPYMDNHDIKCLKAPTDAEGDIYDISVQGYSFPSGHSTNAAVIYGALPLFYKKTVFKVCAFLLPFLVGLSRLILGVHYPTDVIGGWIMGYGSIFIMIGLGKLIKKKEILYLVVFLISAVGMLFCDTEDYYTSLGVMAGFFLAVIFEERFVFFENTRKPLYCVLRIAGGILGFVLLNYVLKLPFSEEFLKGGSYMALIVRFIRYTVLVFLLLGVYPMSFRIVEGYIELKKR